MRAPAGGGKPLPYRAAAVRLRTTRTSLTPPKTGRTKSERFNPQALKERPAELLGASTLKASLPQRCLRQRWLGESSSDLLAAAYGGLAFDVGLDTFGGAAG